jgi:hypothetical protein
MRFIKPLTWYLLGLTLIVSIKPSFPEDETIPSSIHPATIEKLFYIQNKIIIKAVEPIIISSTNKKKTVKARIDTGASQSSIDVKLAKDLGLKNYIGKVNVISANGVKTRDIVEIDYELSGKKIKSNFTLADRSNLNYPVLIGRNDLKGFIIDPID